MKRNSKAVTILLILVVLTTIFTLIHLNSRPKVEENHILISWMDVEVSIDVGKLEKVDVKGELVNGKGETREIDTKAVPLLDLLNEAKFDGDYEQVKVIASDEYSAKVTADEINDGSKTFFAVEEDGSFTLIVFGDENSKRNVTNVVRMSIE